MLANKQVFQRIIQISGEKLVAISLILEGIYFLVITTASFFADGVLLLELRCLLILLGSDLGHKRWYARGLAGAYFVFDALAAIVMAIYMKAKVNDDWLPLLLHPAFQPFMPTNQEWQVSVNVILLLVAIGTGSRMIQLFLLLSYRPSPARG